MRYVGAPHVRFHRGALYHIRLHSPSNFNLMLQKLQLIPRWAIAVEYKNTNYVWYHKYPYEYHFEMDWHIRNF